jgi:2-dehydro-3-deoxygluconokinase
VVPKKEANFGFGTLAAVSLPNRRISRHGAANSTFPQLFAIQAMSNPRSLILSIGEVMIEMTRGSDGRFRQTCAGDTFNTAVYLARRGLPVAFASALGDDPYSDQILTLAASEGIATELVSRVPGRLPGLCLVETTPAGDRIPHFWREGSPACQLFELPNWGRIAEAMIGARIVYFSGITLSIYSNMGLGRFLAVLEAARAAGAKVVFDGNYRPRAWHGDIQRTRRVFMEALKRVDIALPTYNDEALLWGDPSPDATIERLQAFGIAEIAIKNGASSALVASGGHREAIPVPDVVVPVDTTAAGDSFNAGYMAARLADENPADAAIAGHRLASEVIRHRGAILPRSAGAEH